MSAAVLFRHPSSVLHDTGSGHPERAARIVAIEETLTALGWLGYDVRESPAATDEQLGAVHPASHTDALRANGVEMWSTASRATSSDWATARR